MDEVCLSNVNRQIHALDGNIGRSKVAVLAERVEKIAPECEVTTEEVFFTEATADRLLGPSYDYIIDAMEEVVSSGSARRAYTKNITICGNLNYNNFFVSFLISSTAG